MSQKSWEPPQSNGLGPFRRNKTCTCKATLDFVVEHRGLDLLERQQSWGTVWHIIESTGRPLTQVRPDIVSVCPMSSAGVQQLWPPAKRSRARQAPKPRADSNTGGKAEGTSAEAESESDSAGADMEEALDSPVEEDNLELLMHGEALAELSSLAMEVPSPPGSRKRKAGSEGERAMAAAASAASSAEGGPGSASSSGVPPPMPSAEPLVPLFPKQTRVARPGGSHPPEARWALLMLCTGLVVERYPITRTRTALRRYVFSPDTNPDAP